MEAPIPITLKTPNTNKKEKIQIKTKYMNIIEELDITQENNIYKIQFGIQKDNSNEMIIRAIPNDSKDYFYFENKYNQSDFYNFSKIFSLYESIEEKIKFLKTLKYVIKENNDDILIKFNIFLPNGENKIIELKLNKILLDSNTIINNLIEQNKNLNILMINNNKEIINNKNEIKLLKEEEIKNKNEIRILKEENKSLWKKINELQDIILKINKNSLKNNKLIIDSVIINSLNEIKFIFDYIKKMIKL